MSWAKGAVVGMLFLTGMSPCALSVEISAGVAVVDITPPVPYRMSGYYTERLSTGVKDPLQAKAVVLRQGDVSAALVFCDLIGIPLEVSQRARKRASAATGIPAENIAVAATHSHTGPLYFGAFRDELRERSVRRLGADPYETVDYPAQLVDKLAAAIAKAHAALRPVELAAGFAREERLSFNRRFHMRDGSVRFNPGQQNADIVRAAGPIDPQVGVVSLKEPEAADPFAAIVAFALHLDTTGGTDYSADYPKFLEDALRQSFGEKFVAMFGAGTCGDINHIDVRTKGVRTAQEIGSMLAEPVEGALKPGGLAAIEEPMLAVLTDKVDAPLQSYPTDEVAEAKANMAFIGTRKLPFLEEVKAQKIVSVAAHEGASIPLEVQAFRLSRDVAIVTLPSEIFVELGLAIKAGSPFKTTIVIELTNDCLGYIPTKKAFAEGSYETVNSRVQPGAGEALVETAVGLLKEFD